MNKKVIVIGGLLAGLCTGLLGTGGGIIAVPLLCKALNDRQQAHRLVMLFILPLSLFSLPFYLSRLTADWSSVLLLSLGGIFGAIPGALLLNRLSDGILKVIFTLLLIVTGVRMLIR